MAKNENPFPVETTMGKMHEQKLEPAQLEQAKRDQQTMIDLDKIKQPLEVKVYGSRVWTYRNDAYREFVNKMDITQKEELEKLIKKQTKL